MQADGPRDNVLDEILIDHAGTFLRVEQREELNTIAEHVERPTPTRASTARLWECGSGWRICGCSLRARRVSPTGPSLFRMTAPKDSGCALAAQSIALALDRYDVGMV